MPEVRICKGKDKIHWEARERLQQDYRWIGENRKSLVAEYENKYVAVMDKKVIYSAVDVTDLMTQIKADGKRVDNFAVEYLSKNPPVFLMLNARV